MNISTAVRCFLATTILGLAATGLAAEPSAQKTYGKGLPRDLDVLGVPDADYPDWPITPDQAAYAGVSGERMKEWTRRISDISLRCKADGNACWGRLPGTEYDRAPCCFSFSRTTTTVRSV